MPGLGVLNTGGGAAVRSMSWTSAGNCAAGGYYKVRPGHLKGFVAAERNGVWGRAAELPGLGALSKSGQAQVLSVSCTSEGNCAAGGDYQVSGHSLSFVASEKNGVWGQAIEIPGLGTLNTGGTAHVRQVSCGVWGTAINVPGLQSIVTGRWAEAVSVSCASPGNCAVSGDYESVIPGNVVGQGYVVSQRTGRWDQAFSMPGLRTLSKPGDTTAFSVSCGAVAHCAAWRLFTDGRGHLQGFVTQASTRTGG